MAKDIVIVGFKVEEDNSVFYKKLRGIVLGEVKDDAKQLGRRFIGIDLNRDYVKMAQWRLGRIESPLEVFA